MSFYRCWLFRVLCLLCFFAKTAGAQSNLYWGTSTAPGLQPGNGNWSTSGFASSPRWSFDTNGTSLSSWENGNNALFETSGTSVVTVTNINDMTVNAMVFDRTGYTIANAGLETVVRL